MSMREGFMFLHRFLGHPKRVGSAIPSSRFLAEQMVKPISWDHVQSIAELGSGTGAITRFLQAHAGDNVDIILFEMDKQMREYIRKQYPQFSCYANARHLYEKMQEQGIEALDCVVSGLPFFNFGASTRRALLDQVVQALKPGGLFITYQYSLQMKKMLADTFVIEDIRFVPINMPPAFVYICRKKNEQP
ncbi:class I SAM-dependent methyltransferase [Paenibacillus wenxiniae]|uniref:Class I SAM-dependent methyltransferase n=1 Tax=Paenibacillus wenxiniae TaxID=1636843 RepID=A0ABW4RRD7_9BACL